MNAAVEDLQIKVRSLLEFEVLVDVQRPVNEKRWLLAEGKAIRRFDLMVQERGAVLFPDTFVVSSNRGRLERGASPVVRVYGRGVSRRSKVGRLLLSGAPFIPVTAAVS